MYVYRLYHHICGPCLTQQVVLNEFSVLYYTCSIWYQILSGEPKKKYKQRLTEMKHIEKCGFAFSW